MYKFETHYNKLQFLIKKEVAYEKIGKFGDLVARSECPVL